MTEVLTNSPQWAAPERALPQVTDQHHTLPQRTNEITAEELLKELLIKCDFYIQRHQRQQYTVGDQRAVLIS